MFLCSFLQGFLDSCLFVWCPSKVSFYLMFILFRKKCLIGHLLERLSLPCSSKRCVIWDGCLGFGRNHPVTEMVFFLRNYTNIIKTDLRREKTTLRKPFFWPSYGHASVILLYSIIGPC